MDRRQCRHLIGTRTRMRSAADALWRAGGLEKQVARHCFVHFAWSMTCPWSFIQPRPEPVGDLLCLPTLDRPRLEFFRLCHDGGLVRPSGKMQCARDFAVDGAVGSIVVAVSSPILQLFDRIGRAHEPGGRSGIRLLCRDPHVALGSRTSLWVMTRTAGSCCRAFSSRVVRADPSRRSCRRKALLACPRWVTERDRERGGKSLQVIGRRSCWG